MRSMHAAVKSVAGASAVLVVLGLVVLGFAATAAQASATAAAGPAAAKAAKAPPAACRTFTRDSADALFGLRKGTKLKEKQTKIGSGSSQASICTVTKGAAELRVITSIGGGGFGGPFKCYKRPKLGSDGRVCVSTSKSFPDTFAIYNKHGIGFSDNYNRTLPHQGARLYAFALAQYKAYKG
jgi:hypothetical protein